MRSLSYLTLSFVLLSMLAGISLADVPLLITHQGRLTTQAGEPVDPRMFDHKPTLFLEVLVDGNPIPPRTLLTASPYSIQSAQVQWNGILGMPGCFSDGVDNVGSGPEPCAACS